MLERPALYNQAHYARLETLITDDAELQMLSYVFDDELIAKQIPVIANHPYPLQDHNPVKAPKQQQGRRDKGHQNPKPQGSAKPATGGRSWFAKSRSKY